MKGGGRNPRAAQGQGQEEPSRGRGGSAIRGAPAKAAKGCTELEISPPAGPRLFGGVWIRRSLPLTHLQFLEAGRHLSLGLCFVASGFSRGCCDTGMER